MKFKLPRFFARRYLFSPQSKSVINLISGLSVLAVAIPVAAMLILLSVFNGLNTLVKSKSTVLDPDVSICPWEGKTFTKTDLTKEEVLKVKGVKSASYYLEQSVLLEKGERQASVLLRGVDEDYPEVYDMESLSIRGDAQLLNEEKEQLLLGNALAWNLGIRTLIEEDITVYSIRRNHFSSLLPLRNFRKREVAVGGLFTLDGETEQRIVLAPYSFAEEVFSYEGKASCLGLALKKGADIEQVVADLDKTLNRGEKKVQILTKEQLHASFFRIMEYEKWGIFFILFLVLLVASFTMVGAEAMLIVDKRADMATLRALGADVGFLRRIFVEEGLLIGLWGLVSGIVLGATFCFLQQTFGWIKLPSDTFLVESYPVEFRWEDLVAVVVSMLVVGSLLTQLTVRNMIKK